MNIGDFDPRSCSLEGAQLVEASAGTGKTWNIGNIFLRLIAEGRANIDRILVVTFTRAATAELRERLRGVLTAARDELAGAQSAALGFGAEAAPVETAERLQRAIEQFDEAAIFTIHGYCQRILSEIPFRSGGPFRLEPAANPGEEDILLQNACDDFWRREVLSKIADPLAARLIGEDSTLLNHLRRCVAHHLAKPLADFDWPNTLSELPDSSAVLARFNHLSKLWTDEGEGVLALLEKAIGDKSLHGGTYKREHLPAIRAKWDAWAAGAIPAAIDKEMDKLAAATLKKKTNKAGITPEHPFFTGVDEIKNIFESYQRELEAWRYHLLHRAADTLPAAIRRQRRQRRQSSFDDLLIDLYRALESQSGLAAGLRERYPFAIIDEFQDTDPLQYGIFHRIYGDAGNLVMVGDPKQAIYRFRNADIFAYLAAGRETKSRATLRHNQRSVKPLIDGVNALFGANPNAFCLEGIGFTAAEVGAKARPTLVDESGGATGAMQLWRLPRRDEKLLATTDATDLAAAATAGEIGRLLGAGEKIRIDGHPLHPGDLCVLVRTHAEGRKVRKALADRGIRSVDRAREYLFETAGAGDMEFILAAMAEPQREAVVRLALVSGALGATAADLLNDKAMPVFLERFVHYNELLRDRGFAVAFRRLLADFDVPRRLLAAADGARKMTDLLHLAEHIHTAGKRHGTPPGLLDWFRHQKHHRNEEHLLRLESDEGLVEIHTLHNAKGLQFPIVFCPFLWQHRKPEGDFLMDYHAEGVSRVAVKPDEPVLARVREEAFAEDVRLAYVALTRAVLRQYVVVGCYRALNDEKPGRSSPLNWLLAGGASPSLEAWLAEPPAVADLEHAWESFAEDNRGNGMEWQVLPETPPAPAARLAPIPTTAARASVFQRGRISPSWRVHSYSGLVDRADTEADRDFPVIRDTTPPAELGEDDFLRYPSGALAGHTLHQILERVDFRQPQTWDTAIGEILGPGIEAARARFLLEQLASSSLLPGLTPAGLSPERMVVEMEFTFAAAPVPASSIDAVLAEHGYPPAGLDGEDLKGYFRGFMDLVFEHKGAWYILDWKSNHLGYGPENYGYKSLEAEMFRHAYHLQYLLYAVALHRHLRLCLRDYRPERYLGGAVYVFLRGVRRTWPAGSGIYFDKPSAAIVEALHRLLGGEA